MCSVSAPVTRSFDAKAIASTGSADGSLLPGVAACGILASEFYELRREEASGAVT